MSELSPIAEKIYNMKYAQKGEDWARTCWRVAEYVASAEEYDALRMQYSTEFFNLIYNLVFIPGGRILANAGTGIKNLMNCVSGNTLIHTENGLIKAKDLAGYEPNILTIDGKYRKAKWSNYGKQKLLKISLKNGDILFATEDHKWLVTADAGELKEVTTLNLEGEHIPYIGILDFIYDENQYKEGVRHGLTFGDGWLYLNGKYSILNQFGDSVEIVPRFFDSWKEFNFESRNKIDQYVVSKLPAEYKILPSSNEKSMSYIRGFIAGLIGADGCVDSRGHVMLHNKDLTIIKKVRELCSYVGLPTTSIKLTRNINPFNNEESTMYKLTFVKKYMYNDKMIIMEKHRNKLFSSPNPLLFEKRQTVLVTSVEDIDYIDDVFCCIEPETHTMIIDNCYLTRQCFVLDVEDSRVGIYDSLKTAAEIFANGGGVGYNFSKIRESGADITTTGGKASGPLSFMTLFDTTGDVIQQASRRGAQIGILDIDHPDVEDFINYKSTPNTRTKRLLEEYKRDLKHVGLNADGHKYFQVLEKTLQDDQLSHFNISVLLNDRFMSAVEENSDWELISRKSNSPVKTVKAQKLFQTLAQQAWESGDPGVMFFDRANEDNMVKYLGDLKSSNPCVTGDTRILTVYDGPVTFKELTERNSDALVYCWNSKTKLMEIGVMSNIRKTRENAELVEVEFDSGLKIKCTPDHSLYTFRGEKVQVKDLNVGQSIRAFSMSLHSDGHYRVHGWVNGKARHQYVARMVYEFYNGRIENNFIVHHKDFNKINNRIDNLELISNSKHNIIHQAYRRDGGYYRHNHKIVSITYLNEREDVYNGNVSPNHNYIIVDPEPIAGQISGIVSANCSEIWLLPNEACCLGSINLHEFYDKENNSINFPFLEYVVRTSVRFLDDVQTKSETPIDEINKWTKGLRRLGLGVFGWADLLAELGIPYDSEDAFRLGEYLSWFISFFGWLESIELAEYKGAFPFYDPEKVDLSIVEKTLNSPISNYKFNMDEIRKKGLRNVAITAIAPTGTIAILAGMNSGIEPYFALAYKRNITEGVGNTAKDYVIEINQILFRKLKELNFSDAEVEEIKKEILKHGTLESVEKIPEKLKRQFMTAHEINPFKHVDMLSSWQEYTHNAISKTINLNEDATEKDIEDIFKYMWNEKCKGGTVYRNKSKLFQILNIGVKEKEAT